MKLCNVKHVRLDLDLGLRSMNFMSHATWLGHASLIYNMCLICKACLKLDANST